MTPIEIAQASRAALSDHAGAQRLILTIPKGCMPRGFPRGLLLQEWHSVNGGLLRTYSFDPNRVMDYLVRNRLIVS